MSVRAFLAWFSLAHILVSSVLLCLYGKIEEDMSAEGVYGRFHADPDRLAPGFAIVLGTVFHLFFFIILFFGALCGPGTVYYEVFLFPSWAAHWLLYQAAFVENCIGFHHDDHPCFHYTTPLMVVTWIWLFAYNVVFVCAIVFGLAWCVMYVRNTYYRPSAVVVSPTIEMVVVKA